MENNRELMKKKGVYEEIRKKVEEQKTRFASKHGRDQRDWALKYRDADEEHELRDAAIYDISPSKNILYHKKALREKSEHVAREVAEGRIEEADLQNGNAMNDLFRGTDFELDQFQELQRFAKTYLRLTSDLQQREFEQMYREKTYVVSHVHDRPFELDALDTKEELKFTTSFPANQPPEYKFKSHKEPSIDLPRIHSAKELLQIEDLGCENFREIEVRLLDQLVMQLGIGDSIMNGARHLYNDNWIVDFQNLSSNYRHALHKTDDESWLYPSLSSDLLTVREQEISKRIDALELNDLLNIASNKISEKLLDDLLFGAKMLTEDGDKEVLMKAVENRMFDYLQKLEDQQATKKSEDSSNFMRNLTVNKETGQFKMSDTKLVKISNEESVKYELVSDLSNKEDFMNVHFLDGIGSSLEWKNSVITKELIAKMDRQISKK